MTEQDPLFSIDADRSGSHLTLYADGELDAVSAPVMLACYAGQRGEAALTVWLDLSGVSFCDSSGIAAIYSIHAQASERGGSCKILHPSRSVARVLEITGLDRAIPTYRERQP